MHNTDNNLNTSNIFSSSSFLSHEMPCHEAYSCGGASHLYRQTFVNTEG
jgi:hypothetical protein